MTVPATLGTYEGQMVTARLFVEPFLLPFHLPCLAVSFCGLTESESVKVCAEAGIEIETRTAPIVLCSRLAIYGPTVNRLSYSCIPKNICTENIVISCDIR